MTSWAHGAPLVNSGPYSIPPAHSSEPFQWELVVQRPIPTDGGANCEKHPKVLGKAQRAKSEALKLQKEKKKKKKKIRMPRAHPTHTAHERAGARHTRQSFDESWDRAPASGSFLCLALQACIGVRGLEASDKTLGAEGLPLLLPSEVDDI